MRGPAGRPGPVRGTGGRRALWHPPRPAAGLARRRPSRAVPWDGYSGTFGDSGRLLPWQFARVSSELRLDDRPIPPGSLEQIASLIAPPLCAACGAARPDGEVLCARCLGELSTAPVVIEPGPAYVDLAVSASPFEGVGRRIVHGLKFGRRLSLAAVAAEAMLRALPVAEALRAVVSVPAGPWRWRWRGFDPAEELAIAISDRAGVPSIDCLRRGGGRRQVGRRRAQRLADPPRVWLDGVPTTSVLLVDDVWTTGATLSVCAAALRSGGCRRIVALTLARAL